MPAIQLVTGPMMTGRFRGERLGACTDCRRYWACYRTGEIDAATIHEVEARLSVTAGTCAVMGTASTMAVIAETLGNMPPGTAAIPAVHSDRLVAAEATGAAAMRLAHQTSTRSHRYAPIGGERAARASCCQRFDERGHPSGGDRRTRRHRIDLPRLNERYRTRRRYLSTSSRQATTTWKTSTRQVN